MYVGTLLYGYCEGYFGRDSYSQKRIEAIGADWIVVREESGTPNFADFEDFGLMEACIRKWSSDEEKKRWEDT